MGSKLNILQPYPMESKYNSKNSFTIKLNKKNTLSLLCFLVFLIYSSSLKASAALSHPIVETLLTVVAVLLLGIIVFKSFQSFRFTSNRIIISIVLLAYYAINLFYIYTTPVYSRILITTICLVFLYQDESIQARTFQMMKRILAITCVLGVGLLLLVLMGIHGPLIHDPIDYNRQFVSYYFVYFYKATGYWRYCGFYNEPGALGTFCALFLCADSLDLKKWDNIALLIGGLLSFSLAFFVIVLVYIIIKSATNWKKWFFLVLIIIAYLFVLPNISTGNAGIDTVLRRITFDGYSLVGDNRTNRSIDVLFYETLNSQYILFGRKLGFANTISHFSVNLVGPSYKTYIIDLGVVGSIMLFAPLFIAEIERVKGNRNAAIYIFLSFVNMYQRAMLLHRPIYFVALVCGVSYILQSNSAHKEKEGLCKSPC